MKLTCFSGVVTCQSVGNSDEDFVQDMKKALENPSLGIKVIYVRSPRGMAAAPISPDKPEGSTAKYAKDANWV